MRRVSGGERKMCRAVIREVGTTFVTELWGRVLVCPLWWVGGGLWFGGQREGWKGWG